MIRSRTRDEGQALLASFELQEEDLFFRDDNQSHWSRLKDILTENL
jgi:hypothetical protein